MNLTVCMESSEPCDIIVPVLVDTVLPKPVCNWKTGFIDPDFSYSAFLTENDIGVNDTLDSTQLSMLLHTLGLTDFLLSPQCDRSGAPYTGAVDGWTNRWQGSFETRVNFEPCLFKLTVSIEELTFDILLSDYVWTEPTDVWLFGFVRMEFTAVDLVVEGDYMLDLVLRVCMEADADTTVLCFININVLTKYRLPKEQCDWDFNFFVNGFSLNSWLATNNYTRTEPLPLSVSAHLLSHLNIQSYLNHPTCQQGGSLYTTVGTRWNNVCGKEIDLPMLSEDIVCRVNDSCTTIDCCVNVPLLNQTFNFYLDIDPCYQEVTVGIEKMLTTQKLLDGYTFGSFNNFTLLGVDFALNQWLRVRSESTDDILPAYYIAEFLQQLDLTSYLQDTPCSRDNVPYVNATNGWHSDCADNITLPSLWSDSPPNPLTCSFNNECSGVSCCIDSMFINRSFYTNLELDPCEQKLHIGIEKLQFTVSLLDFVFDKDQEFSLKKTIRILYNIYDLKSEDEYLITLKIAVCWETYLPCDWTATLFENTRIPKKPCSQRMDYVTPDFSLTDWAADNGVDVNNMIDLDVHKFYDAADIGWFLQFPSCDRGDSPFGPSTNGWNNTCPGIITDLNDLPSTTSCHISTSCTDVRCCVEIPTLNNFTVDFTVSLDDCQKTLTVTIEKWTHSQMLHNYTWGTEEYFWVRGIYRIKFRVIDLNDQALFRLYISFEACFDAGQPCTQTVDVMNSIELPKQECTWSTGYRISDCPLYVLGDLVFLLDESISVGASHFNKSLEAIASAVNNLAIGANLTRVGFVVFGGNQTTNRTIFDMNYDKAAILNGILDTKHDPGIANTVSVLKYICDNKFTESAGGRTDVQNYLVVLSDGRSANHEDIKIQADLCSTAGIRIIGVPIGDAANDALLKAISYFDPSYYVKTVYNDLGPTIAALVNSSVDCSSGFFLKSWKTGHGLADNAVLNQWQISSLMQENRITEYVVSDQCSLTDGMFSGSIDGWVNGKYCLRPV
ncbi:COL12A [Mytilus edulis]|uniref:COL12A n=1 Tax=Mytilus edulis TaxID=6550 RepID=A0A8S3Q2E7_MYTED|nr:COL12A [Mytilus edulis]